MNKKNNSRRLWQTSSSRRHSVPEGDVFMTREGMREGGYQQCRDPANNIMSSRLSLT